MVSRLFCSHCQEYCKVDVNKIRLIQEHMDDKIRFANNTYYFKGECFFKELAKIKNLLVEE